MPRDFLCGLIDRAFERAPVLQKRRPSLFEPAPGEARLSAGWMESERKSSSDPAPPALAPRMPEAARAPEPQRRRAPLDPAENAPTLARPALPAEPTAIPGEPQPSAPREPAGPAPVAAVAHAFGSDAPPSIERIVERQIEARQTIVERRESHIARIPSPARTPPAPVLATAKPAAPAREERPRAAQETSGPRDPVAHRPEVKPSPVPRPALNAPAPRTALRARPAAVTAAPAVAPTIQVTIGRIELRVPQTAVAARQAPGRPIGPKLELDEYLRQRNGGTR